MAEAEYRGRVTALGRLVAEINPLDPEWCERLAIALIDEVPRGKMANVTKMLMQLSHEEGRLSALNEIRAAGLCWVGAKVDHPCDGPIELPLLEYQGKKILVCTRHLPDALNDVGVSPTGGH